MTPRRQSTFKSLPKDFAEQILQNDIILVVSKYQDQTALNNLIQLYMKGIEYYEMLKDPQVEYFKAKLQWLMNHPQVHQQPQTQSTRQSTKLEFKPQSLAVQENHYNNNSNGEVSHQIEVKRMIDNLRKDTSKINEVISQFQQIINIDIKTQNMQFQQRLNKRSKSIHPPQQQQ